MKAACSTSRAICGGSRKLSSKATSTKTHVVFLHEGHPKSEFYTRNFLANFATSYYNLPRKWRLSFPTWLLPRSAGKCIAEYGLRGEICETTLRPLEAGVRSALTSLLPERAPFTVSTASPYLTPNTEEVLLNILKEGGSSEVVLMPLSPHFACYDSGLLLNEMARVVAEKTIESSEGPHSRLQPLSSAAIQLSAIHRWSSHPLLASHWSGELEQRRSDVDAVLYVAPSTRGLGARDYRRSVWASCERTMAGSRAQRPWRLAFYNSWHQWPLPFPLSESISSQLSSFGKEKRVLVLPVTALLPSFDTISHLPSLLTNHPNTFLVKPQLSPVLVQGISEVVKNHLLGRRDAQLQLLCRGCFRNDCQLTRLILSR